MTDTPTPEELRRAFHQWCEVRGIHAAEGRRQLEALTGVSARTLERIEQGRGFRYPRLLLIALEQG